MKQALSIILIVFCCSSVAKDENPFLPKVPKNIIFSHYRVTMRVKATLIKLSTGERFSEGFLPCGTAFAIDCRKLISANHVVRDNPDSDYFIDIFDKDGEFQERRLATIVKRSETPDIVLFSVVDDLPEHINLKNSGDVDVGDWVYVIGSKHALAPFSITWGQLVAKNTEIFRDMWQSTASVSPGNSGGSVYCGKNNKIIGLLTMRFGDNSCSLFIPIKTVKDWLKAQ